MAQTIQIKRGLKAELENNPNLLQQGEFGFCTDTKEVYIGTGNGIELVGQKIHPEDITDTHINKVSDGVYTKTAKEIATYIDNFNTLVRTNKLNQMSPPDGNINMNFKRFSNLASPTSTSEAATKGYVDAAIQGLDIKNSVELATTANLNAVYIGSAKTLTATANGVLNIDNMTPSDDARVLVKAQTEGRQNGIYVVTSVGSATTPWILTRADDFNNNTNINAGAFVFVTNGTQNGHTGWVMTNPNEDAVALDLTPFIFTQFSGAGSFEAGAGLTRTGNTVDLDIASPIALGGVKIGANITVDSAGTISVAAHPATHPASMITGLAAVATSGDYNSLLNKPSSLPANGGNADTLDGMHSSDFLHIAAVPTDGYFDTTTTSPTGTARLNYNGYLYATRTYTTVFNDYAEYFQKDEELQAGDVVCKNTDDDGYVKSSSAYSKLVVGVVSSEYAHCIGGDKDLSIEEQEKKFAPIGMSGRVSVKVVGKVSPGDMLVSSNIPGVAMAVDEYVPCTVIGKALESYDSEAVGKIKMLISSF